MPAPAAPIRRRLGLIAGAGRTRITQLRGMVRRTLRRPSPRPAARHTPPPEPRRGPHHGPVGPARAPASLVSGRKGGGHMIAHDSAGPHPWLVPPQLVLFLRYLPGPPSPRPSAGPGLGRRGAAGAGGRRPCSRSAHGDGEPL